MAADFPKLEQSWVWPSSVERLFRELSEGRTLHVCCGTSNLGDVTVDADPDRDPDVVADMEQLPFEDCSFDTAIWDPPWRMSPFDRNPPYFEVVRCVKPNGVVLANTQWFPVSHQTVVERCYVRQDVTSGYTSLITVNRRWPGQECLTRWLS